MWCYWFICPKAGTLGACLGEKRPETGHHRDRIRISATETCPNVKHSKHQGPVLIHAMTTKGKGYKPAEDSGDKYHGVSKFNVATGEQVKS